MAALVIETPPAIEPISLASMKSVLKSPAGVTVDDEWIGELIQSAREQVEGFTGRSLINKGYRQSLDSFPYFTDSVMSQMAYPPAYYSLPRYSTTLWNYSQMIKVLRSPLVEVSRISIIRPDNSTQDLRPAIFNWIPATEYVQGEQIEDSNSNVQEVTAVDLENADVDGTFISGPAAPTWATGVDATTTDGPLTWTCRGPAPTPDFIYDPDSMPGRIFPVAGGNWPPVLYVPNAVQIHFVAGHGTDTRSGPAGMRTAMRQLVSDWYFNREPVTSGTVSELPNHVKSLLWMHRIFDLAPTRG